MHTFVEIYSMIWISPNVFIIYIYFSFLIFYLQSYFFFCFLYKILILIFCIWCRHLSSLIKFPVLFDYCLLTWICTCKVVFLSSCFGHFVSYVPMYYYLFCNDEVTLETIIQFFVHDYNGFYTFTLEFSLQKYVFNIAFM